jgi:competence protein ComEC
VDPGLPAGKSMFIDLLAAARTRDLRWVAGRAGTRIVVDGVVLEVLFPLPDVHVLPDANDNSLVFRLSFGGFAALFLGDAPTAVEEVLVARHGGRLRADVLKVGHHGSTTSTGDALLAAARPGTALVSAGRRNRYGHPAPGVVDRLHRHGVRVLRTDVHGSVMVRARPDGRIEATPTR